eukprot:Nk52_evm18s1485 gene=Nk52_evmTU18s1485
MVEQQPGRECSSCGFNRPVSSYSKTQWWKPKEISSKSSQAVLKQEKFAEGTFKWVDKGEYTEGERCGHPCVMKWFKTGVVYEAHYFATDLKVTEKAVDIIQKFNDLQNVSKQVLVNIPQVWTYMHGSSKAGQKTIVEPFILNYQKFNSNTGWKDDSTPWPKVMQALSHFSYHVSRSNLVLCDLQGGVYSNGVCLSDPVILSTEQSYGPTDLGPKGISNFFSNHRCNEFCRGNWLLPRAEERKQCMPYSKGTSMEHVPTKRSRRPMTLGAIYE